MGSSVESPTDLHAKIFDGPAIIHTLTSKQVRTFDEYGDQVFLPWINQKLQNCNSVDIIWDRYISGSLKESTREKRGKGIRRKVQGHTKLPTNFSDFLRDTMNKTELFDFLTEKVATYKFSDGKQVYITSGKLVLNYYHHYYDIISLCREECCL